MSTKTNNKTRTNTCREMPVTKNAVWKLQDEAHAIVREYFNQTNAPASIRHLVLGISNLYHYLVEFENNPELFGPKQFDIQGTVASILNDIAAGEDVVNKAA